jgi:hypothetical protein
MGAFLIFLITTILSFVFSSIIWRNYISKRSATIPTHDYDNHNNDLSYHDYQQQNNWTVESNDCKLLVGDRYSV